MSAPHIPTAPVFSTFPALCGPVSTGTISPELVGCEDPRPRNLRSVGAVETSVNGSREDL